MIRVAARLRRVIACIAGATIVGVPLGLLALQRLTPGDGSELVIVLPPLAGLGVATGLELATALRLRAAAWKPAWTRTVELVALILFGVLGGALAMSLAHAQTAALWVEAVIALAFCSFGVVAAMAVISWRMGDAARIVPFCAVLGVLYGISLVTGALLTESLTVQCQPHTWCIEPVWQDQLLPASLFIGLPVGIWLGIMLWLALAVGRYVMPRRPAPLTN